MTPTNFTYHLLDAFMDLLHNSGVTSPKAEPSDTSDHSHLARTLSPMHRSYSSEVISPVTRFDFDDSRFKAPSTPNTPM